MEPETITERPIAPTERLVRCLYRLSRGDYYYTVAEVTSHGGMKHESGNETHKKYGLQLDSNQNHLVLKRTLNHLAKLTKRLSCVLSTYLYGAFNCMFLSCHVGVFRVNPHSERKAFLNIQATIEWGFTLKTST